MFIYLYSVSPGQVTVRAAGPRYLYIYKSVRRYLDIQISSYRYLYSVSPGQVTVRAAGSGRRLGGYRRPPANTGSRLVAVGGSPPSEQQQPGILQLYWLY